MLSLKFSFILFFIAFPVFSTLQANVSDPADDGVETPQLGVQSQYPQSSILADDQIDPNLDLSQVAVESNTQNIQGKGLIIRPCKFLCKTGSRCYKGRCVPYKCPAIPCKKGYRCVKGICVKIQPELVICPANSIQPKKCIIRPTQKQCPTIFYFRQPDPVACGIRADGTRVDFSEDCSACKDKSIVYYFSTPCHKIPLICSKGQQCLDYYCANSYCSKSEDCPYDWQTCFQNKCIDSCSLKRCRDCKYGQCAYLQPNGNCFLNDDSKCENGWKCIVSQCGDKCWNKPCPPTQDCNKNTGQCYVPIVYPN